MTNKIPTFEEAMKVALIWINEWNCGELSDEVLADRIKELLKTKDGTRGFLVISLSSDHPLMDRLSDALLFALH